MRILFLLTFGLVLMSCGNNTPADARQEAADAAATATAEPKATLPSLPIVTLEYLWKSCDFVDYVFYELPVSMSLDNKKTIQYVLSHIAEDPAPLRPECKSIGRIFYQVEGENVLEADMYFSEGCTYLVFLEDGKAKYANYMTKDGVDYLNNNFQQVNKMTQGQ
ncbi:MAG: hypothetical protein KDC44_22795 [Phaeodactylibacter sp.]|nr:hypothetical protein [Phaeodactylibacter sp.]